jgi:hypothetical protein
MSLIKNNILLYGFGIDIGDGIMNFLFKKNTYIPNHNKIQYIIPIENEYYELNFYFGDNDIIIYNKHIYKINLPSNNYINIEGHIYGNYIYIFIFTKNILYNSSIFKLNNYTINEISHNIDIYKKSLIFEFKILFKKINNKINNMNINNNSKNNIINKINTFYQNINNYENQKIYDNINLLKKKFMI